MQSHLESAALAVSHIKSITQAKILLPTDADEEDEEQAQAFLQKAESLVSQIRSAKVVSGKSIHQLDELLSRSLTLDPMIMPSIEQAERSTSELASICRASGLSVAVLVNEEARATSLTYAEVTNVISPNDSTSFAVLATKLQSASTQIQSFYALTSTLSQTIEIPAQSSTPPWTQLSARLRQEFSHSAGHEHEAARLRAELVTKNTALALAGRAAQDQAVSVEVLEKRLADSDSNRDRLRALEADLATARAAIEPLARRLAAAERELRDAQAERAAWERKASNVLGGVGVDGGGGARAATQPGAYREVDAAQSKALIAALRAEREELWATVRQLRLAAHEEALRLGRAALVVPLEQHLHQQRRWRRQQQRRGACFRRRCRFARRRR